MYRISSLSLLLLLPLWPSCPFASAQDFSWINNQLSEVISYEKVHFSQCSQFPDLCPPVAASCASALCANCPKYYDTCCLQSTTAANVCFQSLAAAHNNAGGGGGGMAASATAMPTANSGGGDGSGSPSAPGATPVASGASATTANATPGSTPSATPSGAAIRAVGWNAELLLAPVAAAAVGLLG